MIPDTCELGERFATTAWQTMLCLKTTKITVKLKLVYGYCLITTLAWRMWAESQSETTKLFAEAEKAVVLQTSSAFVLLS